MKDNLTISYHKMRRWVGYLGLSLPFLLLVGNYCFNHFDFMSKVLLINKCVEKYSYTTCMKESISDFYYTSVGELFVGTLCAVAFFLFSYKGYPKRKGETIPSDSFMTNLAGICALLVAVFPTHEDPCMEDNFRIFVSSFTIGMIHNIAAIVFFISLGLMSFVNFRRTATVEEFGTKPSHNYYKYCGFGIFVSLFMVVVFHIKPFSEFGFVKSLPIIYISETTSLVCFGLSWLKKGQVDSD